MTARQHYKRSEDGATMIEVASGQYVEIKKALALGLVSEADVAVALGIATGAEIAREARA